MKCRKCGSRLTLPQEVPSPCSVWLRDRCTECGHVGQAMEQHEYFRQSSDERESAGGSR